MSSSDAAQPTTEIVVVGSMNLDLVVTVDRVPLVGETVLGSDLQRISGGKGANQAVAAARLGRRVGMIGRVGDDEAGNILRAALETDRIDTRAVSTTIDTPSGVALIAVGADGDNAIVVSPGANARLTRSDVQTAGEALRTASVVLLQLEIPPETVAEAAARAEGFVILNPAPAPTGPLPRELLAEVDVLVPNQTELSTLAGYTGDVDPKTAIGLAQALPSSTVVVTLGANGALVVEPTQATHIAAPSIDPVDTTAAGDAFCGALADGIAGGASIVEAARWAVRVGAATCLHPGAQPSLPTPDQVAHLLCGQ